MSGGGPLSHADAEAPCCAGQATKADAGAEAPCREGWSCEDDAGVEAPCCVDREGWPDPGSEEPFWPPSPQPWNHQADAPGTEVPLGASPFFPFPQLQPRHPLGVHPPNHGGGPPPEDAIREEGKERG